MRASSDIIYEPIEKRYFSIGGIYWSARILGVVNETCKRKIITPGIHFIY